jgi:cell wall-associated NlpC family hydrolase
MTSHQTQHQGFSSGWTNQYIDIPFLDQGRTRDGLDCWGLVRLVYKEQLGIDLQSLSGRYESAEDSETVSELVEEQRSTMWFSVDAPEVGDVIVLNILGNESHVGIRIDHRRMLHIMRGANCCIQNLTRPGWKRRVSGHYRHWSREPVLSES